MIRQGAPCIYFLRPRFQGFHQTPGKISQSLRRFTDDVVVLVARSRKQIAAILALKMWWAMPGTVVEAAKLKQFLALLCVQSSPEIHLLESSWSSRFSLSPSMNFTLAKQAKA